MYSDGLAEQLNLNFMKIIWILIYAHSGVIQEPEIFYNKISAMKRKKEILKDFNDDYDDLGVFEELIRN